jgi:DNA invertase Pin-like site-specific DNA recombinase
MMGTAKQKSLIGYVRVSTSQQGRSGLGIEAQKEALERFAASEGCALVRVFVEIETGKGALNARLYLGKITIGEYNVGR